MASVAVRVTVRAEYHAPTAVDASDAVVVGAVASRLTVTDTGSAEPIEFAAKHDAANVPSLVKLWRFKSTNYQIVGLVSTP